MSEALRLSVFTLFVFVIAVVDFKIHKIPDFLLAMLLVVLLCVDILWAKEPLKWALALRFLAAAASFGLFYLVYRFKGGLGFGDVKYTAVIGYFLGPYWVIAGLLFAVFLGIAYWCAGRLLFRWGRDKRFAFGPWLGLGAVMAYLLKWGFT